MDHATCFGLLSATHFATSLLPLTVRLIPVLTEIGRLIVGFRRAELTPQVGHQFETQLHAQLRELGRIIVAWTFNHIEPRDRRDMPNQMYFQGVWYRRRSKTPSAQLPPSLALSPSGISLSTAPRRRTVDLSLGDPLGTSPSFLVSIAERSQPCRRQRLASRLSYPLTFFVAFPWKKGLEIALPMP